MSTHCIGTAGLSWRRCSVSRWLAPGVAVVCRRDLNPNNVLVYKLEPGVVEVKIADFGLSRELETGVVKSMTGYVGSPSYIAPEVLSNHAHYSETADVYSFGIFVWFVSQHLFLQLNPQLYSTPDEHRSLMTPYRFGTSERLSSLP